MPSKILDRYFEGQLTRKDFQKRLVTESKQLVLATTSPSCEHCSCEKKMLRELHDRL